jgi:hypothetical protein
MSHYAEIDDGIREFMFNSIFPTHSQAVRYTFIISHMEEQSIPIKHCQRNVMKKLQEIAKSFKVKPTSEMWTAMYIKYQSDSLSNMQRIKDEAIELSFDATVYEITQNHNCVRCFKKVTVEDHPMFRCGHCQSMWARYCGRDCQRDDWRHHKHFCKTLQTSELTTEML